MMNLNYFETSADLNPLLHTWSLAVEEQFYILYPIMLFLAFRLFRRRLTWLLWTSMIVSIAFSVWFTRAHPTAAFYFPAARADELLIGAIVAAGAVPKISRAWVLDLMSLSGIAMIFVSIFLFEDTMVFPGAAALLPCIATAFILYSGEGRVTAGGRLLSLPVLVFFGSISYSLYLWHWPAFVFTRYATLGDFSLAIGIAAVVFSVIAGWLSWRYVEQPVLQAKLRQRHIFAGGAITMLVFLGAFGAIVATKGLPQRFGTNPKALFASAQDYNRLRYKCHNGADSLIPYNKNCVFGASDVAPSTAIWGDSFGAELSVAMGEMLSRQGHSVMQITASACPAAIGYSKSTRPLCPIHNRRTLKALIADKRIKRVIIATNFQTYERDKKQFWAGFAEAVLKLHRAKKRVTLIYPIPQGSFPPGEALGMLAWRGQDIQSYGISTTNFFHKNRDTILRLNALADQIGADKIHPASKLCDTKLCHTYVKGIGVLYFNSNHLSVAGARYVLGLTD